MSAEEEAHIQRFFMWDGESRRVEFLNSRRKSKKTYEYEVKWFGKRDSRNSWITREQCAFLFPCFGPLLPLLPCLMFLPSPPNLHTGAPVFLNTPNTITVPTMLGSAAGRGRSPVYPTLTAKLS